MYPSYLKENPQGNYKYALENGMKLIVEDEFLKDNLKLNETTLFIEEGGALEEASYGLKILADEITEYKSNHNIDNLKIFLPSGTGTTALFLQKYLECRSFNMCMCRR